MAEIVAAPELGELAAPLIELYHAHLKELRIGWCFSLAVSAAGLGSVKRVAEDIRVVAKDTPHFVITIWNRWWDNAETEKRLALLDHVLCHCGYDLIKGKTYIEPHEFEGFVGELRRHGAWDLPLAHAVEQLRLRYEEDGDDTAVEGLARAVRGLCRDPGFLPDGEGLTSVSIGTPGEEPVVLTAETGAKIGELLKQQG